MRKSGSSLLSLTASLKRASIAVCGEYNILTLALSSLSTVFINPYQSSLSSMLCLLSFINQSIALLGQSFTRQLIDYFSLQDCTANSHLFISCCSTLSLLCILVITLLHTRSNSEAVNQLIYHPIRLMSRHVQAQQCLSQIRGLLQVNI